MNTFNHEGVYQCVCGKTFSNSQSFNAHKSNCRQHYISKYGSDDIYNQITHSRSSISNDKKLQRKEQRQTELNNKLLQWISEQHTCEKCGKIMTEWYGSGRFCSGSCAQSRQHTDEERIKISQGVQRAFLSNSSTFYQHQRYLRNIEEYSKHPNICKFCGNDIPYERRYRKSCCNSCAYELQHSPRNRFNGNHYRGYVNNIYCQSSWEMAYVLYCNEHNIKLQRCSQWFSYNYNNETKRYYPDFYLPDDNTYVEIKGFYDEKSQAKIKQFPYKIKLLQREDMKDMINYVISKYGDKFYLLFTDKRMTENLGAAPNTTANK